MDLLYTTLLYQVMTNRNINAATLLEQYRTAQNIDEFDEFSAIRQNFPFS